MSAGPLSKPDSVRLPPELRAYLREQAALNHRSFSGELTHRLEASRRAEQQAALPQPRAAVPTT